MGDRRDRGVYRENLNPFPVSGSESPKSKNFEAQASSRSPDFSVLFRIQSLANSSWIGENPPVRAYCSDRRGRL